MKRLFLSFSYDDLHYALLLQAQLSAEKEFQVHIGAPIEADAREAIEKQVIRNIQRSSFVISIAGSSVGKWQEWELRKAIELGIPILGLLTSELPIGSLSIYQELSIPVIQWTYAELIGVLKGDEQSLTYDLRDRQLLESPIIKIDFEFVSSELIQQLVENPSEMYSLSPRKFEELVAFLLERMGYEIELTQQTRDGGIDIFALRKDEVGSFLTLVDCKRYAPDRPVGIGVVRSMYGVLAVENASHAVVATTSHFTSVAKAFEKTHEFQISLKQHADILNWMKQVSK